VAGELAGHKHRDIASLPAVGEYLPPIDGGEVSVAPPVDWNVLPRGRTFLLGFAKGKPTELPRIVINAEEPPAEAPLDLTEENAAAFAEQQDAALQHAAKTGKKKVHEFHLPIVLGENVFVRHVRQASLGKGVPCAVQSLQTIRGGRLYTVDLLVPIDPQRADEYGEALTEYRDYGYAVAAHLKFASPIEPAKPIESGETNPEVPAKETNPEPPAKKSD
jgi:hypothetical protein